MAAVRDPSDSVTLDAGASVPSESAEGDAELSASELFSVLWQALADILGTAAAATLLRRAAQRAASRFPELAEVSIGRDSFEYRYTLPPAWGDRTTAPRALRELARELWRLLEELTGHVVVNGLAQIPALRDRGIVPEPTEES